MCSSARSPGPTQVAAAMFTPASLIAAATSASAPGVFWMSMTRSVATACAPSLSASGRLLPAPAGLRPIGHVVHRAEAVGDAVLAAVPDKEHVGVAELSLAVRAAAGAFVQGGRLGHLACIPVSTLNRPGDDVLQAAEDRAALACGLVGAEAVVRLDLGPAPGATLVRG